MRTTRRATRRRTNKEGDYMDEDDDREKEKIRWRTIR